MTSNIAASDRLIVALDVDTPAEAMSIVETLDESVSFYKVGHQLFGELGMVFVQQLIDRDKKVFLDLKLDDTPRTVTATVRRGAIDGVVFYTLQGNAATARAAKEGRGNREYPKFLQVTYLSSWDRQDVIDDLHLPAEISDKIDLDERVVARTQRILDSGCDGVIASGTSVAKTRQEYGKRVIIVTPGIRPSGSATHDHKRVLTPAEAIRAGADFLVVGRPIRDSNDPRAVAVKINSEIKAAYQLKKKSSGRWVA